MKPRVSISCSILICALGTTNVPAQAQRRAVKTKPDFTGTWLLNTGKSNVGSSATSDQPIKISHHDPEFRITRMVESNGRVTGREFLYYTDGRGETMFLSTHTYLNPQSHEVTRSKTTWSRNKLVTRSRSPRRSLVGGQLLEFEII